MAHQWTHDRPYRAPSRSKAGRRQTEQQPRLELPVPMPCARPDEKDAQPSAEAPRGVADIDFYV